MKNKRKYDRIEKKIKCEVHSDGMTFSSTIDVSNGGLFISTPEPLNEGSEVTIHLHIENREPLVAKATVKWIRDEESDNLRSGMGVEFINDAGKSIDLLDIINK